MATTTELGCWAASRITMKRHTLLALLRLLLAVGVLFALPFSHLQWGESYPGDGQQAFGFIIIFTVIGFIAAAVFVSLGTLGQFFLRKRPARLTVFTDLGLFVLFSAVLVYEGVTAKYNNSQQNKGTAANRRPTLQSNRSGNLSATLTADRTFPAAVADLDR